MSKHLISYDLREILIEQLTNYFVSEEDLYNPV
jgi:hypothetical protein